MATALGHEHHTRVQQWHDRGAIPLKNVATVLDAARRAKIKLKLADFFDGAK